MRKTNVLLFVAAMLLMTSSVWATPTEYKEPLPGEMAPVRVFMDGYDCDAQGGAGYAWAPSENAYGNEVYNLYSNPGWVNAYSLINGQALTWNVSIPADGMYEIWLSEMAFVDNPSKHIEYNIYAGADESSLRWVGYKNIGHGAYDSTMKWTKCNDQAEEHQFYATDTVVRLALYTTSDHQGYAASVDELVLATIPEPGTLILLGLGSIGVLSRRRRK